MASVPMLVSDADARRIETRIKAVESATGVQVVCAVHARADSYPEVPWRAFALAVVMTALPVLLLDAADPRWPGGSMRWLALALPPGAGLLAAALALVSTRFARLFVTALRQDAEVAERAKALSIDAGLHRAGVPAALLFVSRFERRGAVVASAALASRCDLGAARAALSAGMADDAVHALLQALDVLEGTLLAAGCATRPDVANVLPDAVLQAGGQ